MKDIVIREIINYLIKIGRLYLFIKLLCFEISSLFFKILVRLIEYFHNSFSYLYSQELLMSFFYGSFHVQSFSFLLLLLSSFSSVYCSYECQKKKTKKKEKNSRGKYLLECITIHVESIKYFRTNIIM